MCLGVMITSTANAQKAPTTSMRILAENDKFMVYEFTWQPNATHEWHSHKAHTGYLLTDAKMKIEVEGQETAYPVMKKGQALIGPAGKHQVSNLTNKPVIAIVTEEK